MSGFEGKVASVTGGGSGLGEAIAKSLSAKGVKVVVSDINLEGAQRVAKEITGAGGTARAIKHDTAKAEDNERVVAHAVSTYGALHYAVNNAGIGQAGEFLKTPEDQWDRVLDINLGGVVNGCRAFGKRLVERGTGGHIVNVSSMAAFAPLKSLNAYCTSKAAVYMFSDCLRAELDAACRSRCRIGARLVLPVDDPRMVIRGKHIPDEQRVIGVVQREPALGGRSIGQHWRVRLPAGNRVEIAQREIDAVVARRIRPLK